MGSSSPAFCGNGGLVACCPQVLLTGPDLSELGLPLPSGLCPFVCCLSVCNLSGTLYMSTSWIGWSSVDFFTEDLLYRSSVLFMKSCAQGWQRGFLETFLGSS